MLDNVVAYWRASLADADRVSLDEQRLQAATNVSPAAVAAGRVTPEFAAKLIENTSGKRVGPPGLSTTEQLTSVLICPIVAYPITNTASPRRSGGTLLPLWIPANLAPNGALLAPEELTPWVARELLEPTERSQVTFGSVDVLDHFLMAEARPGSTEGWPAYWAFCCRMLKAVTGIDAEHCVVDGYRTADVAHIIPADTVQGSRLHVIALYDRIREDQCFPALLQRYAARENAEFRPLLDTLQQRPFEERHLGQMGATFPLSPSQRETIHHFLASRAGEILAVNGPPGTGKTTLIQSIVATLWVEAALREAEPPVLLATSTNNQAVTNIIESFGKVADPENLLAQRWLPDVTSYGLYCVSDSPDRRKMIDQKGFQAIFPTSGREQSGFFAARETSTYVARASADFLTACTRLFERRPVGIEDAARMLHQRLVETVKDLQTGLALLHRLQDTQARIAAAQRAYGTLDLARAALGEHVRTVDLAIQRLWHHTDGWKKLKAGRSLLDRFRHEKVVQASREYFAAHPVGVELPTYDDATISRILREQWEVLQRQKAEAEAVLQQMERDQTQRSELKAGWWQWTQAHGFPADLTAADAAFDTVLRHRAFCLASHYWEARWLIETQQLVGATSRDTQRSREQQMLRWRRYAKLTPCFVSTLFMAPRFFSAWENRKSAPLYEFLDLLIVDEAGQVPADVGGATFALAKQALVVGDTFQIEPVYALSPAVDAGNLRRNNVAQTPEEQARFRSLGLSSVAGSLMEVAQRASHYQKVSIARGMFLAEHRRCLPEIIAFCNELAYAGALDPQREAEDNLPLPPLGYAHVSGACVSSYGSRQNSVEAETIVAWLVEQAKQIQRHYGKPLDELVGIITPFARQAGLLQAALSRARLSKVTAGTVHTFQGAERRIIIFSPVYDRPGSFFFDQGVHMLNVAVSRAQDSFLVFGRMAIFEPANAATSRKPSSILARHLFQGSGVELMAPVVRSAAPHGRGAVIRRLRTLQEHRDILARGLQDARHRVVIVSPYLSDAAIKADQLDTLIAKAVRRGVEVVIYTDSQLDVDPRTSSLKPRAAVAREKLRACGTDLRVVRRIHNKTLCIDEMIIVTGSFNWLSAVRDETHAYQRYEESTQYEGVGVAQMIAEAIGDMEQMPLLVDTMVTVKP